MTAETWVVEETFLGHSDGWSIRSGYDAPAGAREEVRQCREAARRRGMRLRIRKITHEEETR